MEGARLLAHTGEAQCALPNSTPWPARRSRCGVIIHGQPSAPMVSQRCSSVMITMMLAARPGRPPPRPRFSETFAGSS